MQVTTETAQTAIVAVRQTDIPVNFTRSVQAVPKTGGSAKTAHV